MSTQTVSPSRLATPERSLAQRQEALSNANAIRSSRAELKREIGAGRVSAAVVLANPPEWTAKMDVYDVLRAIPQWGRVRVSRLMTECRVAPSKTVGGLTERQRGELVAALTGERFGRVVAPAAEDVLWALLRAGGPSSARSLNVAHAGPMMATLEDRGLICKASPARSGWLWEITPAGRALLVETIR